MNEGGTDSHDEEGAEPIEPKIAPPEVEYKVDTASNKPYVSPDPRGFVWPSVGVELQSIEAGLRAILCGDEEMSISDMVVIAIPNSDHEIRSGDIIPNLIRQMEAVRAQILRRKPGSGKELDIREKISDANAIDDPREIKFVLETGELGDSEDIFKQYRHVRSGSVMVAKLTPDGKLFLPKIPEEWGQLFVEQGA